MSSTNKTTNLELSQFLGSDSPKWLTDYNADMEKIDAGYQTVKAQADATDLVVGGHTSSISTLQDTTTSQGTAIAQLHSDVNSNTGSINTINSLIGNGEPTTTNKTIIGGINELHADISTKYIADELAHKLSITADGVKTAAELYKDLADELLSYIQSLDDNIIIRIERMSLYKGNHLLTVRGTFSNTANSINIDGYYIDVNSSGVTIIRKARVSTTAANNHEYYSSFDGSGTYSHGDIGSDVVTSGTELTFTFEVFDQIS